MEDDSGSENYSRVIIFLNRGCTKLMRAVVSEQIERRCGDIEPQQRLGSFLFDNRKTLFPGGSETHPYNRGFERTLYPGYGRSTDIDQWDLQLLAFIVLKTCDQSSVALKRDISELKKIRNALCHSGDCILSNADYNAYKLKIRIIFKRTLNVLTKAETINDLDLLFDTLEFEANTAVYNHSLMCLKTWYEYDKCEMGVKLERLEQGQEKMIDMLDKNFHLLRAMYQRSGQAPADDVVQLPEMEVVVGVKNCNPETEKTISNAVVSLLDSNLRCDNVLKKGLSEDYFQRISVVVQETIDELSLNGLKLSGVHHGCVVLRLQSSSYEKLKDLWHMAMKGILTKLFHGVEDALKLKYPEVHLEVFIPKCEWWRVTMDLAERIQQHHFIQTLSDIDKESLTRQYIETTHSSCIKSVEICTGTDVPGITTISLTIAPTSDEHMTHISEVCKNGTLDEKLKNIADALKEVYSTEDLELKVISDGYHVRDIAEVIPETMHTTRCINSHTFKADETELMDEAGLMDEHFSLKIPLTTMTTHKEYLLVPTYAESLSAIDNLHQALEQQPNTPEDFF